MLTVGGGGRAMTLEQGHVSTQHLNRSRLLMFNSVYTAPGCMGRGLGVWGGDWVCVWGGGGD